MRKVLLFIKKTYYKKRISTLLYYLSTILILSGIILVVPFIIGLIYDGISFLTLLISAFMVPSILAILLGIIIKLNSVKYELSLKDSMLLCTLSWLLLTFIGGIPFVIILKISYLDACFETMSGFTTTGITVLTGLDDMPRSILFWRALTQWIGGLGILSMFVLIGMKGSSAANKLFLAEGHKVTTKKPAPGLFNTARILWIIYIFFTVTQVLLLMILNLDFFDAITHSFTTISTGGFSIYDNSIMQYKLLGYKHYNIIEIIYIIFMLIGGMNFFVHYRYLTGDIKSLWDTSEIRWFWKIIVFSVITMFFSGFALYYNESVKPLILNIKTILFQVVSILTTTGYATQDINGNFFTAFAKQLFLVLMVIGGCAGSTGGGIKVIRFVTLKNLIQNRLFNLNTSTYTDVPVIVDNERISDNELKNVVAIFFIWILLLVFGGGITALFSDLTAWESYSGMFSALGNIGPCYITVKEMAALHPIVKITYILGMLAGRLEILPVIIIFSWKFYM